MVYLDERENQKKRKLMGDIIERLNNLNDIEDLKKIVKEVLKRELTNEELSLIENEDDEIIENLLREITQELEKNIPEEEKEDFYANISEDLLVYIEDDKRKLERPEVFKGGPATLEIISSMKDVQDKIRAVDFIPDEFAREDLIKKLGTEFLREYIKSPNRTMKDADLEVVIRTYGDRECVKEYIKLNPRGSKVYLIQGVGDIDFIKECLEDEEIEFTKGERIELIKKAKDIELTRNAIYDESLGLTNNEKLGLLESVNNLGLISTYIHDENCSLSEENICALVKSTNNREFIKKCILDNTLGINRNARMSMVQSVNEDIGIVQEIMDSPELGLNEGEKTNIVAQTNNVAFIENFLEVEENLGNNNQYKLLHMVEKDSAFIKKLIREDRIIQGSHNKLNFILNTGDQEFIKESIYDKNTSWNPSEIRELIASVEDEAFVEKCFQDEQLNLQTEDIYQILDIGNFSQDFFKRCILNPELDVDDDERYDLVLKYIKDDEIVLEIVRDEKIDVETWKKLKLLGKVQEPVFSENIEEIMAILKQNDESYKEFRNESETPEGIYNNIDQFFKAENVELANRQQYKEILGRMFQKNEEVVKKIDFRMLDSKYIDSLGEDKINQISCYPEIQEAILGMDEKTYAIFCKCLNNRAEKNERWTSFASDIIENLSSGEYEELIQRCDLENTDIEILSSILQSRNVFDITTTEQVNNIHSIRNEICDKIMSGEIQRDFLENYSELDKKRFAVLEKIFGQDIDKTQSIISAFGENIEELADKEENAEIIDYIRTLKLIMQEENEEVLSNMYKEVDVTSNINTELMEAKLKSAYCEKMNEGLFQITEETKKIGENIYEAGTDFRMIITSIAAFNHNQPENYERDWNKSLIGTQHFCTNYIRNDMMGKAPEPHLCYGFASMEQDALMMSGTKDLGSGQNELKITTSNAGKFCTPDNLVNETEIYNELDYARYQGGKKKQPDYIVVFEKDGKRRNWENALKAQKEWGGLPIVVVNVDKCLENERNKVQDLLTQFHETSDTKVLEEAIQKIRNNRQTNGKFCEDINIEEMKKQLGELQKREEKTNEQVTLEDLEENYEMVDAMDRKKEASKISQIYTKLRQIQREGAGYEL